MSAFRQIDVQRAIQACRKAGLEPGRVEIEPGGKIIVLPTRGPAPKDDDQLDDEIRALIDGEG